MEREPERMDYEYLLDFRFADVSTGVKYPWLKFAIAPSFNIFVTSKGHEHLSESYGVSPDETLTEGEINFHQDGSIKNIHFKPDRYQHIPGFTGTTEDLAKLKAAVEKKIRSYYQGD